MRVKDVERLYASCYDKMIRTAYKITGNKYDAEDVVQMCFEWVQKCYECSESELIGKCRHVACALARYKKNFTGAAIVFNDPEDVILGREAVEGIYARIRKMKRTYRDVMCLYVIERMKVREIALALGMKYDTASKKVRRGKKVIERVLIGKGIL